MYKYFKILILLLFASLSSCYKNEYFESRNEIYFINNTWDLATRKDLPVYLKTLRKIVEICLKNEVKLQSDVTFGLFLLNVNMKLALRQYSEKIPARMVREITVILTIVAKVLQVKVGSNGLDSEFWNDTAWVERIAEYQPLRVKMRQFPQDRLRKFQQIENYYKLATFDVKAGIPDPSMSDRCMMSLQLSSDQTRDPLCAMHDDCYTALLYGDNFGYFLTHRLLWILLARYGKGCSIISQEEDRQLTAKFCQIIAIETQLLVNSGLAFGTWLLDLFFEQIGLCYLDGHEDFIQREWLSKALAYQQEEGRFVSSIELSDEFDWHVTGVAALAYSSAVRDILSKY